MNKTFPFSGPPVLALGAWLKNTVCVSDGKQARVSQLIGDLGSSEARAMLGETVARMSDGLQISLVAHDLHPDFYSTQLALDFAMQRGLPTLAVQHHHAHIAAVCAEHGFTRPVLGLALDGVGLGSDGLPWGGELLMVDGPSFRRLGHLAHLMMPGGDRAAIEPWRMASAALFQMGRADEIGRRFSNQPAVSTVSTMLQRGLNCPKTSSAGRLFDAAGGLLGVCEIQHFEAEAAMALQGLAQQHGRVEPLADGWKITEDGVLDFLPLLSVLADCNEMSYGAALFHDTLVAGLAEWVFAQKPDTVALGGGCFYNDIVLSGLLREFGSAGMNVLTSAQPGDSAISLGQAWVAARAGQKPTGSS